MPAKITPKRPQNPGVRAFYLSAEDRYLWDAVQAVATATDSNASAIVVEALRSYGPLKAYLAGRDEALARSASSSAA